MVQILAHRGNTNGPSADDENQLATAGQALARGFGLEIDIRQAADGRFYIAHDPLLEPAGRLAEASFAELRRYPRATVALNIKEEGGEAAIAALVAQEGVRSQVFVFDMELVEAHAGGMARRFHAIDPALRIAARVSDRGESLDRALGIGQASVIWLDEFDRLWATEADVRRLKDAGRAVYAVSPDLHQFPHDQTRRRWREFLDWGVDGICTDYAEELARLAADSVASRRARIA
ncbi:MAG: hypothetical protein IT184_14845 [Acidobacteria bacterium]|nr:hypothetical protein [Acidobacteriota bacterium]